MFAIILVGGYGTRIRHITGSIPKPLVEVCGSPFLHWIFQDLKRVGIKEVFLLCHYHAELIEEFCLNDALVDFNITCIKEISPLGTGGAVLDFLSKNNTQEDKFLLMNGDSLLVDFDLKQARDKLKSGSSGVIFGVPMDDATRYGTLDFNSDCILQSFKEKKPGSGVINSGVYLFKRDIFTNINLPNRPLSFESDVIPHLLNSRVPISVIETDAHFIDIGTEESLARADSFIQEHAVENTEPTTMKCRVCDSNNLEMVLDLGLQPWCNNFLSKEQLGTEPYYPLRLFYCTDCQTSQLDYTVDKQIMFGDHTYLSGITKSLSSHFNNIAIEVNGRFGDAFAKKSILDIGSNDGTQLKHYLALGWDVLGVESSKKTSAIAISDNIPTINRFFNLECIRDIDRKFSVINAAGVFFHLEELHSVTEAIKFGLDSNGVFVVQFLYMKSIMENNAFDQIYHEHLLYYTLKTIQCLLKRHGLELFDAYLAPIHGGQMIGFVGHPGVHKQTKRLAMLEQEELASKCNEKASYIDFAKRVEQIKERDLNYLAARRKEGKRIFSMGAPVKGNTLLNYFKVGPETIEYLVEKNELRRGLYSPGMHIPIAMETEIIDWPDIFYVLAWNFKKEILKSHEGLIEQGVEFYFPIDPGEQ